MRRHDQTISRITSKLDQEGLRDYEVSEKIPDDVISIDPNLSSVKIYIPEELDGAQYEIDDHIRQVAKFIRINTTFDGKFCILSLSGTLQQSQLYRLIKYLVKEQGFCTILSREV